MFLYQYKCRQLCFTKGCGKWCIQHKGNIHWRTKSFPFALYPLLKSWLLVEDVATINWLGLLTLLAFPRTDPASRHTVNASKTSSFQVPSSIPSQTWRIFLSVQFSHLSLFSAHPPLYCDSLQSKVTASSFQWSGNAMSWYLGIIWIFHAIRTYNQCQQNISSLNAERKDLWCLSYSWLSYLFPVHCKNLPSLLTSAK